MLYVTKGNQQFKIDEDEVSKYASMGYKIMDAKGNSVETGYHPPVPYEDHIKEIERAVEAAKSVKVKDLEAKIKKLEAEIEALKTEEVFE